MIRSLKAQNRLQITLLLFGMSGMCFALSVFRYLYTDTKTFLFLNWNLFLAFVPWCLSTWIALKPDWGTNRLKLGLLLFSWLIFFPNAPYILTDLFHLRRSETVPIWYDLVLILSYAWTGMLFGFLSLFDIERCLNRFFSKLTIGMISAGLLFLSAFGIYLGRYQRWNSWDLLHQPGELLGDILDRFVNPSAHPRTWGMTIFMGILLNMIYWSFRSIQDQQQRNSDPA